MHVHLKFQLLKIFRTLTTSLIRLLDSSYKKKTISNKLRLNISKSFIFARCRSGANIFKILVSHYIPLKSGESPATSCQSTYWLRCNEEIRHPPSCRFVPPHLPPVFALHCKKANKLLKWENRTKFQVISKLKIQNFGPT